MKRIERYLLRELLPPTFYCFTAFALLYVIYDVFDHLSDFIEAKAPVREIALYYAAFLAAFREGTSFLTIAAPITLFCGCLYAVAYHSRNNEITALRASGISLLRITRPYVAVAALATLTTLVIQETVSPHATYHAIDFSARYIRGKGSAVHTLRDHPYYNVSARRYWVIGTFDMRNPDRLGSVEITQERPDGNRAHTLYAAHANWLDGRWWLFDLRRQRYDQSNMHLGHPSPPMPVPVDMPDYTETPADLRNEVKSWFSLSSREMQRYLANHPNLSPDERARRLVDFHLRLAMPSACIIVSLLATAAGLRSIRHRGFVGVILAVIFFFGYYVLIHVGTILGKKALVEPWIGAWLPNLVFFLVGLWMLNRMR